MKKLTLEFPDSTTRGRFVAWFLDAGGENDLNEFLDEHRLAPIHADSPDGHELWDWQRLGEDADEHVLVLAPVTDEDV
jgi:hypothetical protein